MLQAFSSDMCWSVIVCTALAQSCRKTLTSTEQAQDLAGTKSSAVMLQASTADGEPRVMNTNQRCSSLCWPDDRCFASENNSQTHMHPLDGEVAWGVAELKPDLDASKCFDDCMVRYSNAGHLTSSKYQTKSCWLSLYRLVNN